MNSLKTFRGSTKFKDAVLSMMTDYMTPDDIKALKVYTCTHVSYRLHVAIHRISDMSMCSVFSWNMMLIKMDKLH
jgi:hypothetical protein